MAPIGAPYRPVFHGRVTATVPSWDRRCPVRESVGHDLPREEEGAAHPQRLEEQLTDDLLIWLPSDLLEDESGQTERRAVVRDRRPQGRHLLDRRHASHVAVERVVALAGLLEQVAVPARRVVQQVKEGDLSRDLLVLQSQLGDVGAHRCVQIDPSLLHEAKDRGWPCTSCPSIRSETASPVDREGILDARDSVERDVLLAVEHDPNGDAGDLQPVGQERYVGPKLSLGRHVAPPRQPRGGNARCRSNGATRIATSVLRNGASFG